MTPAPKVYERFRGRGRKPSLAGWFGGTHSLWLADDHLLDAASSGYTEDYRRFYYRDIQSIVVERTSRTATLIAVSSLILLLTAGFYAGFEETGLLIALLSLWPLVLILLIHAGRGPTCNTWVQTAVSREMLPALSRVGRATRALAIILPRIAEVQGPVDQEALRSVPTARTRAPVAAQLEPPTAAIPTAVYRGGYHLALFAMLLVNVVLALLQLQWASVASNIVGLSVTLAILVCVVAAIAHQRKGSHLPSSIRRLTGVVVAYVIVEVYTGMFYGVWLSIRATHTGSVTPVAGLLADKTRIVLLLASAAISAILAVLGLMFTLAHRRKLELPNRDAGETTP